MVKVRSSETVPFSRYFDFVMYYVYVTSYLWSIITRYYTTSMYFGMHAWVRVTVINVCTCTSTCVSSSLHDHMHGHAAFWYARQFQCTKQPIIPDAQNEDSASLPVHCMTLLTCLHYNGLFYLTKTQPYRETIWELWDNSADVINFGSSIGAYIYLSE